MHRAGGKTRLKAKVRCKDLENSLQELTPPLPQDLENSLQE